MSVVPARTAKNDNVHSNEKGNKGCVTEETEDQDHKTKELLASIPPLHPLRTPSPTPDQLPPDQVLLMAAAIFQQLRIEKPITQQFLHYEKKTGRPLPESGDKATVLQAYQLAFSTLKYQGLLEDIITDSCFNVSQNISSDLLPLAMVMLFDFQDRKFLLRSKTEEVDGVQEVEEMMKSLQRSKIKLAASMARCRVKLSLQNVSDFLSDHVRTREQQAKTLPLYTWINTLRTSLDEMCEALQRAGLCEAKKLSDLTESTFCRDHLCSDTLVFSHHLNAALEHSSVAAARLLNIQDRSACVVVNVLGPLLLEKDDVLAVGSFSALTVAHVAVAAAAHSSRVLMCAADHTPSQVRETQELFTQLDIKNVRVLSEPFFSLNEWDSIIKRLRVVLVLPQCSCSGLSDPVPTMYSEHGDWAMLPHLSHGPVSKSELHSLIGQQDRLLSHALSFPKVQTVLYCTRSVYPEENEELVLRVLEKTPKIPKVVPFRVTGPIFPDEPSTGDTPNSRFFRQTPSELTNGCFIARLSRQTDSTDAGTIQNVLARAMATGLLGLVAPEESKTGKKGKSKKQRQVSSTCSLEGESPGEEELDLEGAKAERGEKEGEKKKKLKKKGAEGQAGPKKKVTKKKVSHSQEKLQKNRQIPRLTLTLISSAKKVGVTPIAAAAHPLGHKPVESTRAKAAPPPKTQTGPRPRAEIPPQDTTKPVKKVVVVGAEPDEQVALKGLDFVLPHDAVRSRSSSSSRSSISGSISGSSPRRVPLMPSSVYLPNVEPSDSDDDLLDL